MFYETGPWQGVCTLRILKFPAFPGWFWVKFPAFSRLGLKTLQLCTQLALLFPGRDSSHLHTHVTCHHGVMGRLFWHEINTKWSKIEFCFWCNEKRLFRRKTKNLTDFDKLFNWKLFSRVYICPVIGFLPGQEHHPVIFVFRLRENLGYLQAKSGKGEPDEPEFA